MNNSTCFVDGSCVCVCVFFQLSLRVTFSFFVRLVLHVNVPDRIHAGLTIKCICTINITVFAVILTMLFFLFPFQNDFVLICSLARTMFMLLVKWNCIQRHFVIFPNHFYYMPTFMFIYFTCSSPFFRCFPSHTRDLAVIHLYIFITMQLCTFIFSFIFIHLASLSFITFIPMQFNSSLYLTRILSSHLKDSRWTFVSTTVIFSHQNFCFALSCAIIMCRSPLFINIKFKLIFHSSFI